MGMAEHSRKNAHFSGLVSECGPGRWWARAWIREPDSTLIETIGPRPHATVTLAQDWLSQAASDRGFADFEIVIERLGDEALLVENVTPDGIDEDLAATDVDA
jgi:hypothetical protein